MAGTSDYQVTARKWRPAEFNSVVGQEHITQTLKNAIENGRLHHAYLFSGPRGVGKTTTARILAKALNCLNPGADREPCNECESCLAITEGRSMDVVEIDGASNNSVDDVRALRDNAKYPPVNGDYKLYIIDEVHMLSTSAFNALLKTLEEPPKHLIFIFATTEPHKVLPTILSRCQRFDFRRMQIEDIVARLKFIAEREEMKPEEDGLVVIARKGDGSMRDAQSIFDQVISFCGPDFTYAQVNDALNLIDQEFFFRVTTMMKGHQPGEAFEIVEHIMRTGFDPGEFLVGLAEHFRNMLSVLTIGSGRLIETTASIRERYQVEAAPFEQGDIIRALHLTLSVQNAIRSASQPRLRLELLLIQLAVMDSTVRLEELLDAIQGMPEGGGLAISAETKTSGNDGAATSSLPSQKTDAQVHLSPEGDSTTRGGESSSDAGTTTSSESTELPVSSVSESDPTPSNDLFARLQQFPTSATIRVSSPSLLGDTRTSYQGEVATADVGVSIQEVRSQWRSFLDSHSEKMGVMYALHPAAPGELQGNVLRLCVENERQRDLIEQYREDITSSIQTFFKQPLIVEGMIGSPPVAKTSPTPTGLPSLGNGSSSDEKYEAHPFVQGIIELLGAVKI
ncbi:MAG: DNA polymerase III subunit gamma/tau [Ignavibacteriae bacterium]|nr:DNA polymerase III subunit gamma/tau [Ignavibacteriota bacterium]MCB9217542.1 DNA polymerase III subunit gamma/tau [Ignavibacteria bacterium]